MWSTSQPGVEESRGRMRLVTPEPRELAECRLPRSQHLRVSEGPPLAPQSWPSIMGAILLLRAGPGRPRPREGVGTAFGTLSKYSLRGACSLSSPQSQTRVQKQKLPRGNTRDQAPRFLSQPEPCFKKAKMFVWGVWTACFMDLLWGDET